MYNWTPYNTNSIKGPKLDYISFWHLFSDTSKLHILKYVRVASISFLPNTN